jgi:hypothetical protein
MLSEGDCCRSILRRMAGLDPSMRRLVGRNRLLSTLGPWSYLRKVTVGVQEVSQTRSMELVGKAKKVGGAEWNRLGTTISTRDRIR